MTLHRLLCCLLALALLPATAPRATAQGLVHGGFPAARAIAEPAGPPSAVSDCHGTESAPRTHPGLEQPTTPAAVAGHPAGCCAQPDNDHCGGQCPCPASTTALILPALPSPAPGSAHGWLAWHASIPPGMSIAPPRRPPMA